MPGYQYTAYDIDGREQRGVLDPTARGWRALLRERGLFPLDVALIEAAGDAAARKGGRGRLGTTDLARITRQLSTLLGAGLTIEQTFNALVEQAESESERQLLARLRGAVLEGHAPGFGAGAVSERSRISTARWSRRASPQAACPMSFRVADYVETSRPWAKFIVAMIYPAIVMLAGLHSGGNGT